MSGQFFVRWLITRRPWSPVLCCSSGVRPNLRLHTHYMVFPSRYSLNSWSFGSCADLALIRNIDNGFESPIMLGFRHHALYLSQLPYNASNSAISQYHILPAASHRNQINLIQINIRKPRTPSTSHRNLQLLVPRHRNDIINLPGRRLSRCWPRAKS